MNKHGLKKTLRRKSQRLKFLLRSKKGSKKEVVGLENGISKIRGDLKKRKNEKTKTRKQRRA